MTASMRNISPSLEKSTKMQIVDPKIESQTPPHVYDAGDMKFSRIVVTGDVIRTGFNQEKPNQNVNIGWLYRMFGPVLSQAASLPVSILRSMPEDGFDIRKFYHLCNFGLKPNGGNWAQIFDADTLHPEAAEYLVHRFQDALVFGLEIPPSFCKLFDRNAIPYIDLTFHPIRYAKELTLGIRTNYPPALERLPAFGATEAEHYVEANIFKSNAQGSVPDLAPGALLAGQTIGDRVTIRNGGFVSLMDYAEEISRELSPYDVVYFKRHPLVRNDHDIIRFLSGLPNLKIIDENIYDLFCSGLISDVYSLCSGASVEAKYFGLNGHTFYDSINNFRELDDCSGLDESSVFTSIKGWSLSAGWWQYVLGLSDTAPTFPPHYSSQSPIRDTLKQNWGLKPHS
ncbi:hypothetical protein [Salipiger abyssi]|uniref:hypothetical protein n=1 Tax=Salipiger abyssi TaxID=1250539 RepID=UPI001A8F69DF|nr:hypothetical protein [Salipiger abyssi]MBN9889831.1 hypothetical protein [Salipiger abyssi]